MGDFDGLAAYYDLDYQDETADIAFYRNFAARTGSPILDLGCGTGRILIPLAQAGYRVTGIDIAPRMIEIARGKVTAAGKGVVDRVKLTSSDARQFVPGDRFAMAFAATNTFMLFLSLADQLAVLQRLHEHLLPDGICIFDLFNPHPDQLGEAGGVLIHQYTRRDERRGIDVTKFTSTRADVARQQLDMTYIYDELAHDGAVRRTILPFTLHYFWRRELELLLDRAGFAISNVFGSYDLDDHTADSPRMIVVSTKREPGRRC